MKLLDEIYDLSLIKADAVFLEDEVLGDISYADFENRTGRVYNYLLSLKLPGERIAAIRVKRSFRTYIAIVGAIKAAVPFVVIGDKSPEEYVTQVYDECEPVITIDDAFLDMALKSDYLSGYRSRDLHDMAFVIYSTGSSGFFKGSVHEYGKLEILYDSEMQAREVYPETTKALEHKCLIFPSGFYSAVAIIDLVDTVVYRSHLIIIKTENANNVDYLFELAQKKNVYTMEASPRTLPEFLKHPVSCIREYYVAYEMFPCRYNPDYKIYNGYALSESCGILCFMEIDRDYEIAPVGKPVPGRDVRLVNSENRPAEPGEIGELIFVPDYFRGYIKHTELYEKAYRDGYFHTGDLGYYNEDGNIVVIGRKNDIRKTEEGYIVPIFISSAIRRRFSDISKCYVKIFEDEPATVVVAYYISDNEYSVDDINRGISDDISSYSLPTHAVKLDEFEYFHCGKINKNLFGKPERDKPLISEHVLQ